MRLALTREFYIPKNAIAIEEKGLGIVYVGPSSAHKGWYSVTAFREKAIKPDFSYRYRTDAEVDAKVAQFFNAIREHKKRVADRRRQDFSGHNFKVGEIVTNSWGYDQTNVDWYKVTRTTKNYVWLKPVRASLDEATGPMSGRVALAVDENCNPIEDKGEETKHRASGDYVTMKHGIGSKYSGGSLHMSWGH